MKNDEILWAEFKKGDSDAFYKIYDLNYPSLYNYGMRISGNEELTRDSIHDLFLELWESKSRINIGFGIKPYLIKFLRNIIVDKLNDRKKLVTTQDNYYFESDRMEFLLSQEDIIINNDNIASNHKLLSNAINSLTNRQKEIIFLRFYNNLNYKEIANITNIKYQSVRNLISEALHKLRDLLVMLIVLIVTAS